MYFTWKLAAGRIPAAETTVNDSIANLTFLILYSIRYFFSFGEKTSLNPVLFSDVLPDLFIPPAEADIRSDPESVHLWRGQSTDCFLPLYNIWWVLQSFR